MFNIYTVLQIFMRPLPSVYEINNHKRKCCLSFQVLHFPNHSRVWTCVGVQWLPCLPRVRSSLIRFLAQ